MTRRQRVRRGFLWAGVLLGLMLLLAAVSVIRLGVWAREQSHRPGWGGRAGAWGVAR